MAKNISEKLPPGTTSVNYRLISNANTDLCLGIESTAFVEAKASSACEDICLVFVVLIKCNSPGDIRYISDIFIKEVREATGGSLMLRNKLERSSTLLELTSSRNFNLLLSTFGRTMLTWSKGSTTSATPIYTRMIYLTLCLEGQA